MPLHDFKCIKCGYVQEELVPLKTHHIPCDHCGGRANKIFISCAKQLTTIVPSYPGCLKKKAGYVHTHGDKSATKVQSGYGGCVNPS